MQWPTYEYTQRCEQTRRTNLWQREESRDVIDWMTQICLSMMWTPSPLGRKKRLKKKKEKITLHTTTSLKTMCLHSGIRKNYIMETLCHQADFVKTPGINAAARRCCCFEPCDHQKVMKGTNSNIVTEGQGRDEKRQCLASGHSEFKFLFGVTLWVCTAPGLEIKPLLKSSEPRRWTRTSYLILLISSCLKWKFRADFFGGQIRCEWMESQIINV